MRRDPELVRASDIGLWAYCHRAWWLARVQQATHQAPERLAYGVELHAEHGAHLRRAQRLQRVAQRRHPVLHAQCRQFRVRDEQIAGVDQFLQRRHARRGAHAHYRRLR